MSTIQKTQQMYLLEMSSSHEDLRGVKKRDRFKESDEVSEREFQYWMDWLNKNEKRLIEEIVEDDSEI